MYISINTVRLFHLMKLWRVCDKNKNINIYSKCVGTTVLSLVQVHVLQILETNIKTNRALGRNSNNLSKATIASHVIQNILRSDVETFRVCSTLDNKGKRSRRKQVSDYQPFCIFKYKNLDFNNG